MTRRASSTSRRAHFPLPCALNDAQRCDSLRGVASSRVRLPLHQTSPTHQGIAPPTHRYEMHESRSAFQGLSPHMHRYSLLPSVPRLRAALPRERRGSEWRELDAPPTRPREHPCVAVTPPMRCEAQLQASLPSSTPLQSSVPPARADLLLQRRENHHFPSHATHGSSQAPPPRLQARVRALHAALRSREKTSAPSSAAGASTRSSVRLEALHSSHTQAPTRRASCQGLALHELRGLPPLAAPGLLPEATHSAERFRRCLQQSWLPAWIPSWFAERVRCKKQ